MHLHFPEYSHSTIKKISILLLFFITISTASAETYIREYTYKASEADSKITSRINALDQVKVILLQEIGTHVQQEIKIHKDDTGFIEASEDIEAITAGLSKVRIIEEKWDGESFFIKVKIEADPKQVLTALKELREQKAKENVASLQKLKDNQRELKNTRNEIEKLKIKLSVAESTIEKKNIISSYNNQINKINNPSRTISCGDAFATDSLNLQKALHSKAQIRAKNKAERFVGKKLINPYVGIIEPYTLESTIKMIETFWCESTSMPLYSAYYALYTSGDTGLLNFYAK